MQRVLLERTGVPDELHHNIYAIVRGGRVQGCQRWRGSELNNSSM